LWRGKVEFPDLKRAIADNYYIHKPDAVLIENTASGQSALQEFQRESSIPVIPWPAHASKEARADVVSPLFEAGKVWLPAKADWLYDWVDEHRKFPNGKHDDTVDTTSIALAYLKDTSDERIRAGSFLILPVNKNRGSSRW